MSAADLDDAVELLGLAAESIGELAQSRLELLLDREISRNVDRGRDDVVARLAGVDVVVRMDRLLAADHSAEDFDGAVREDFVDVHVRRGRGDRKSTRLNSSHSQISYAVFCLKKKKINQIIVV